MSSPPPPSKLPFILHLLLHFLLLLLPLIVLLNSPLLPPSFFSYSPRFLLLQPCGLQLEIIILRSSPFRVVVRSNRIILYTHQFTEDIPPFSGSYFLGGVPESKIPIR